MTYGTILADTLQSSTAGTAPVFKDGSSVETGQLCRAWINYKGTATVSIRASFNVSSVTVNATGDYTLNFTNAFSDTNYCATGSAGNGAYYSNTFEPLIYSTNSLRVYCWSRGGTNNGVSVGSDETYLNVAIFR